MSDNSVLVVVLDGVSQLEFHRDRALSAAQQQFLDRMDQELAAGVVLGGRRVEQPEMLQRAQFVALSLVNAVKAGQEQVAAAMSGWLATRLPDLLQVRADLVDGNLVVDLVFDKPYQKEVPVMFDRTRGKSH